MSGTVPQSSWAPSPSSSRSSTSLWPRIRTGAASEEAAGFVLLLALGLSMGFGMLVILRGARDL